MSLARASGATGSPSDLLPGLPTARPGIIPVLPAHPCAQAGDVRSVMARVPGVQRQGGREIQNATIGMVVLLLKILLGHGFEECYPALVQRPGKRERNIDRQQAI